MPLSDSCEACKIRKVKCDRAQPVCGWCVRNEHPCEYKERKKPGLRAGYGRELEGRLDRLENQLQEQGRQLKAHLASSCMTADSDVGSAARPENDHTHVQVSFDTSTHHPHHIDPSLSRSPANAYRQHPEAQLATWHSDGSMTNTRFVEGLDEHANPQSVPLASPQSTAPYQATFRNEETTLLPPYDLLYSLVELYFKHVNVWLPLLDRKTTKDRLFGTTPLEEADRVLLHAMIAVTLRFSQDTRLTLDSRQRYHSNSKQRVQLYGLEKSSVRSLQALVILAADVTGDTNGPPGWNLLSLISRSVVQLGLAVEPVSALTTPLYPSIATLRAAVLPEAKTWVEDEERRRLFWTVFLLDRYTTLATAFEFALDEREADRRLPCRDDLFAANKSVETRVFRPPQRSSYTATLTDTHGYFSYHCELVAILGHIHQFLKRPFDIGSLPDVEQWQGSYRSLDSELNALHFSFPDEFANITRMIRSNVLLKNASIGWITLHAAYYLTVIRLNSSAAYPSQTSPIFSSSYSAMQRCLGAVDNMKQLAQFVSNSGLLDKVGPPFAFSVWVCARVTLVHGSTMDHAVDPDLGFFVSILSEMGQLWAVARRYSEILSRVLGEYQQSHRSGGMAGGRVTPLTVRILSDMRRSVLPARLPYCVLTLHRCAFDLDFLISRQPNISVKSYHPTRANTPAPNEMEYLDVFDLFNFPRLPVVAEGMATSDPQTLQHDVANDDLSGMASAMIPNFSVPNPDTDWLFHRN